MLEAAAQHLHNVPTGHCPYLGLGSDVAEYLRTYANNTQLEAEDGAIITPPDILFAVGSRVILFSR